MEYSTICPKVEEDLERAEAVLKVTDPLSHRFTDLLNWLKDDGKCMQAIKDESKTNNDFSDLPKLVQNICLPVNLMDLIDYNCSLGSLAMKDPLAFVADLQQVVGLLGGNGVPSIESQISVWPKFQGFPTVRGNHIASQSDVKRLSTAIEGGGLIKLTGVVTGVSIVINYTKSTAFQCSQEDCIAFQDKFHKVCLPGMCESDVVRCSQICRGCGNSLEEVLSDRVVGEKYLAFILPCSQIGFHQKDVFIGHVTGQAIQVIVKDVLDISLQLGQKYEIIGIFRKEMNEENDMRLTMSLTLEAFNVLPLTTAMPWPRSLENTHFPFIAKLYEDRRMSPWSFASSLAYCFAANVCPGGVYHKLKLSLLLSLVTSRGSVCQEDIKTDDSSDEDTKIHLLFITDDVTVPQRLFSTGHSYSKEGLVHQFPNTVFAKASKGYINEYTCITEGGSVCLAGSGICYIPNLTSLKAATMNDLQKVMEMKKLKLDGSRSFIEKQKLAPLVVNLEATLWATAEIVQHGFANSCDHLNYTEFKAFNQVPKSLTDQFSLVFALKSNDNQSIFQELKVINHLLEKSTGCYGKKSFTAISSAEFSEFLDFVKHRCVKFDGRSLNLLRSFFLASRRVRQNAMLGSEMPSSALQAMINLAKAHAKISLRSQITTEDAVLAIVIYEESMCMRFGSSVLGIQPKMHFENDSLKANLGPENDERMRQLEKQINYFCSSHCPGFEKNNPINAEE